MPSGFGSNEIPLVPGDVYGVRRWRVLGPRYNVELCSFNHEHIWTSGVQNARCCQREAGLGTERRINIPSDQIPPEHDMLGCSCGFYSYKFNRNEFLIGEPIYGTGIGHANIHYMDGVVKVSGRTIEGPYGYRSAHAEIVGLVLAPGIHEGNVIWSAPQARIFRTFEEMLTAFKQPQAVPIKEE